jgi:glucoamylase
LTREPPDRIVQYAPGWPGIPARWTSSAKNGLGTALGAASRVWFTLSHGIVDEVYYPRVDSACTRDLGLIVTDGASYMSEEKRHTRSTVSTLSPGVPAFHLRNVSIDGLYQIDKDIVSDPSADVVLQQIQVTALEGALSDYRVYALLAPHLSNRGAGNTAWVGDYKGVPVLYAERDGFALALACSAPWLSRSVGFVGHSDGWQQLAASGRIVEAYQRAENGNVAMVGEVDLSGASTFVLSLGFGLTAAEAAQRAVNSLVTGFDDIAAEYIAAWQRWQGKRQTPPCADPIARPLVEFSAAVLRIHEAKSFRGGVIASLSIPWGFNKGDDDLGGYHVVWPRDLVEAASGFLAIGAHEDARRVLRYLLVTQDADGHWAQNMWLDGTPYWNGIQMDETALPILLVDLACRTGALQSSDRVRYWPMVRRAAAFIVRNGPVTMQDRWEEDPGYSPFTLAAEIAALLVAAEDADTNGEATVATYLRQTADIWHASLDDWVYVTGTDLARACEVDGYYVRVSEPDEADAASPKDGFVPIKNRPPADSSARAESVVSPDALALVRFGLRDASDPRMMNTVKVIDALLKVETPKGPAWRRYNGDGYGEHDDGSPFDGTGVGRPWPLLTGERAHYELARGNAAGARELAAVMHAFSGDSQLFPEQVWDAQDIPERELFAGGATGSARPLVWAHAEFVKLRRSLDDGFVFDRPPQPLARYVTAQPPDVNVAVWRFNNKMRSIAKGCVLRIETHAPSLVHFGVDDWFEAQDIKAVDTGLGMWIADIDTSILSCTRRIDFTFYWPDVNQWEGEDFKILVTAPPPF